RRALRRDRMPEWIARRFVQRELAADRGNARRLVHDRRELARRRHARCERSSRRRERRPRRRLRKSGRRLDWSDGGRRARRAPRRTRLGEPRFAVERLRLQAGGKEGSWRSVDGMEHRRARRDGTSRSTESKVVPLKFSVLPVSIGLRAGPDAISMSFFAKPWHC